MKQQVYFISIYYTDTDITAYKLTTRTSPAQPSITVIGWTILGFTLEAANTFEVQARLVGLFVTHSLMTCACTHTHCSNHQFSIADIRYWEQVLHLSCSFGWLIFSSFETCLISLKRHRRGTKWFDREEGVAGLADSSYLPLQGHESCSFFMEQ